MTVDFVRDAAATAAVLGFFASSWFGWAQEQPPPAWRTLLRTGVVLSVAVAVAGGVLTWQHWSDATAFDPATSRVFGVIVGIEFVAAGLGAAVLHVRDCPTSCPPGSRWSSVCTCSRWHRCCATRCCTSPPVW